MPAARSGPSLTARTRAELEALALELGLPAYRGRQLHHWIHARQAPTFADMTNLPAALRERLESEHRLDRLRPVSMRRSTDGTHKALLELPSGERVETVLIPDFAADGSPGRMTVCVSSQVGCAMGCTFCATGLMGFRENLDAGQMYEQVALMDRLARETFDRPVTNVVFMGMGEPLLNFDAVVEAVALMRAPDVGGLAGRRITISTVGLARQIRRLAEEDPGCGLAVSLHAPTSEKRSAIMPVNRSARTDLEALREAIQAYTGTTGRRVTYEYCLFDEFNDTPEDAAALADIVHWAPAKVNLIRYNAVDGTGFRRTSEQRLDAFVRRLVDRGVTVTVRRSRGQDIAAACGQLAADPNLTARAAAPASPEPSSPAG